MEKQDDSNSDKVKHHPQTNALLPPPLSNWGLNVV
jgi:hypothetical protein